jgi:hypothetical protein
MASLLWSYLTYPPEGLFEPSTGQYSTIHMRIYLTYPQLNTSQLAKKANWPFNWLILDSWPQKNTWYFNWLILGNQSQKLFDLSTEQYQAIDHRNYLTFQLINTRQSTTKTIWPFNWTKTRQSTTETIWPFNLTIPGNWPHLSTEQHQAIDHRNYLTFQLINTRQSITKTIWPFNWTNTRQLTTETIWPFNWKIPGYRPQKLFDLSTEKYQAIDHRNYLTFQLNNTRQSTRDTEIRQLW